MRNTLFKLLLLLAACLTIPLANASPEQDAGQNLVIRLGIDKNLMKLGLMMVEGTVTYAGMKQQLGEAPAQKLVLRELEAVRPAHQDKWNRAVADVYAKHFSTVEMNSLAALQRSSPYIEKLRAKTDVMQRDMEAVMKPILQAFVLDGLKRAFDASVKGR